MPLKMKKRNRTGFTLHDVYFKDDWYFYLALGKLNLSSTLVGPRSIYVFLIDSH